MALMDQELKLLTFRLRASECVSLWTDLCMIGRQTLRIDAGPLRRRLHKAGISLTRRMT